MEERTSTYVYVLHRVQHGIQLVEIGPHSNIPKQDLGALFLMLNFKKDELNMGISDVHF